jgi:glyceraldehyde-3-phosphate dehydrogenase (NAD(P))
MKNAGITIKGSMLDLLKKATLAVDCTPNKVAVKNVKTYKKQGI